MITRRLKTARSNVFKAMLCREDFLAKVEKLEQAKPSSRVSLMAEICKMFDTMGIACEQDRENAYYRNLAETANLPEFRDVESSIIHAMYESFEAYPTPTQYMLRIVDRLSDPRDPWENDTLRLRILHGNRPTLDHGEGDYILVAAKQVDGTYLPDFSDSGRIVNGTIFDTLYQPI